MQQPNVANLPERLPGETEQDYWRRVAILLVGEGANLPERLPGEAERAYWRRVERTLFSEDDVRSEGDLREWSGCPPFHLDRESKP